MLHHVELWVPNLDRAVDSWGWLLAQLGYELFQDWPGGRSWRCGPTYIVIEQSPDRTATRHDRCRPGLNHLAFHVATREWVDELSVDAAQHGWRLMFADQYPYAGGTGHYAAYLENIDGFEAELVAVSVPLVPEPEPVSDPQSVSVPESAVEPDPEPRLAAEPAGEPEPATDFWSLSVPAPAGIPQPVSAAGTWSPAGSQPAGDLQPGRAGTLVSGAPSASGTAPNGEVQAADEARPADGDPAAGGPVAGQPVTNEAVAGETAVTEEAASAGDAPVIDATLANGAVPVTGAAQADETQPTGEAQAGEARAAGEASLADAGQAASETSSAGSA